MKLVYMGTPDIARVCLEKLHTAGFDIAAVYTKPDTPKNRGMKMMASEVKQYAESVGLPVIQPVSFRDDAVVEELRAIAPDLIVVVAYGKILPQRVLDIPKYGCINMHASILPELRGAGPVQWSILNHCDETGVSAMYLTAGMDEGDVIEIRKTPIDPMETSSELMARLAVIAGDLACDTVRAIEAGTAKRTPHESHRLDAARAVRHRSGARADPVAGSDDGNQWEDVQGLPCRADGADDGQSAGDTPCGDKAGLGGRMRRWLCARCAGIAGRGRKKNGGC